MLNQNESNKKHATEQLTALVTSAYLSAPLSLAIPPWFGAMSTG